MTTGEPLLVDDFRDLLVAFVDGDVDFVLVGGWALALHGYARGTDDMDLFVRPSPENARRVFAALATFGAPVAAHGVTEGLFAHPGYGYRMGVKPNLIEVLTSIDGVDFEQAIEGSRTFELDGRQVPTASFEVSSAWHPPRSSRAPAGRAVSQHFAAVPISGGGGGVRVQAPVRARVPARARVGC